MDFIDHIMENQIIKIHRQTATQVVFFCPACNCAHGINGSWTWNGDVNKPTISPSILAIGEKRCHSYVKDGMIQYLDDCEHDLKGQTVEIPEWSL